MVICLWVVENGNWVTLKNIYIFNNIRLLVIKQMVLFYRRLTDLSWIKTPKWFGMLYLLIREI